jgi:hypothetical protein
VDSERIACLKNGLIEEVDVLIKWRLLGKSLAPLWAMRR